eukprot:gene18445-biopygen20448
MGGVLAPGTAAAAAPPPSPLRGHAPCPALCWGRQAADAWHTIGSKEEEARASRTRPQSPLTQKTRPRQQPARAGPAGAGGGATQRRRSRRGRRRGFWPRACHSPFVWWGDRGKPTSEAWDLFRPDLGKKGTRSGSGAQFRSSNSLLTNARRWAGRAQGGGGGGVSFVSRIPPWHAYLARFSRVRAAMRTAPGACKVGPDDTDELRSSLAFQRLSRDALKFILSVRLAGTKKARDAPG